MRVASYAVNLILPFTAKVWIRLGCWIRGSRIISMRIRNPIYNTETILNLELITKYLRDVFIVNGNGFSVLKGRRQDPETAKKFQIKVDLLVMQHAGLKDFRAWPVSNPRYSSRKTAQGETNCTKMK